MAETIAEEVNPFLSSITNSLHLGVRKSKKKSKMGIEGTAVESDESIGGEMVTPSKHPTVNTHGESTIFPEKVQSMNRETGSDKSQTSSPDQRHALAKSYKDRAINIQVLSTHEKLLLDDTIAKMET